MRHGRVRIGLGTLLALLLLVAPVGAEEEERSYRVLDLRTRANPGEHSVVFYAAPGEVDTALVVLARQISQQAPMITAFGQRPRTNALGLPSIYVGPMPAAEAQQLLKPPFSGGRRAFVCQVDANVFQAAEAVQARWAVKAEAASPAGTPCSSCTRWRRASASSRNRGRRSSDRASTSEP